MEITVWHSSEQFGQYIIDKTSLSAMSPRLNKLYESDANNPNNFHALPDHIKQILYLDAPDLIVEIDSEPIFSIEISTEAGTGHNSFQRFARLAASVENGVPALYIYPEAAIVGRKSKKSGAVGYKWDKINPAIFKAMEDVMSIHGIPALYFYYPSDCRAFPNNPESSPNFTHKGLKRDLTYLSCPDSSDTEMQDMFQIINDVLALASRTTPAQARSQLLAIPSVRARKSYMQSEFHSRAGSNLVTNMSPITSTTLVPTAYLLNYLARHESDDYKIGGLLKSRENTLIYHVDAKYRSDPYPGCLAAIDYMMARNGRTFEDRKHNLVLAWGALTVDHDAMVFELEGVASVDEIVSDVQGSETRRNILKKNYADLSGAEIPRYYMQMRYGSTFSKNKQVRVYSYFADAILFNDGALWRDG